ncbi:MAG: HPr family phosphocarrier protein [Candidatus Omnitrophica bacterium]|nr:HPr family phosphocarrier protein [Candidatus Omnitrophota bacterium]
MKYVKRLTVVSKQGLHARPAAIFVETANKFSSKVTVKKADSEVSGKSILNILTLGVECGDEIVLEVEGEDADEAIQLLEEVLTRKYV